MSPGFMECFAAAGLVKNASITANPTGQLN
jgi:hypothetical protein